MLLDILFPKFCITCKKPGQYICQNCQKLITRHTQVCFVCRKYSLHGQTHPYCKSYTSLNSVIIATQYKNIVKKNIARIKYGCSYAIIDELLNKTIKSEKITEYLAKQTLHTCTEIPMHYLKQNHRGFNQTLLITQWIQKNLGIIHTALLTKNTPTQAQMRLSRNDRIFNLKGSFKIKEGEDIHGKNILLIDDVITTGTTIEEAAAILKKHGANNIIALAISGG